MSDSLLSRVLLPFACFIVVVAGMREAAPIVVPFLLAAFIATICFPLMITMQRQGIRTPFAVLAILIMLCMMIYLFVQFAGTSIAQFINRADFYEERLRLVMYDAVSWLRSHNVQITRRTAEELFNPATALDVAVNTLSSLRVLVTNTFLILLTVVFILLEAAGLPNKLRIGLGHDHPARHGITGFSKSLNRYLGLKTLISLATGFLVYFILLALRIDFPELWALMAFLLNFIPSIGSIIAAVPPVMLATVQFGFGKATICAVGYLLVNVIMGNLIEPRFMGKRLGLSTLVVFLSLVFWGWVLGPVGMFLSVPLTMVVKIAMESNRDTAWISILLGSDPGSDALPESE